MHHYQAGRLGIYGQMPLVCDYEHSNTRFLRSDIGRGVPWAGYTVRLQLTVRKFFCKLATCLRRIFAERLPELVAPYARRSARLSFIIRLVGLALGGQGGSRLTSRLGMAVSSSTLLRHMRRAPSPRCHAHPRPPRQRQPKYQRYRGFSGSMISPFERAVLMALFWSTWNSTAQ
jgi:hypothetical protein